MKRNGIGYFGLATLLGPAYCTTMQGCAVDSPPDQQGQVSQSLAGDKSKTGLRNQYGITGSGKAADLGILIGPVADTTLTQLEADLASMGITCTQAGGCLIFRNQAGQAPGAGTFPTTDVPSEKTLRVMFQQLFSVNPLISTVSVVTLNDLTTVANARTGFATLDAMTIQGGAFGVSYSETATNVNNWHTDIGNSSHVWTGRAGKYPGQDNKVAAFAGTDYQAGAADVVASISAAQCSSVFSAEAFEPGCAGGKRSAADGASVAVDLPIVYNGSALTVTDLNAPPAWWLGRMSLQTGSIATRSDIFGGAAAKHTDVTSGTDALSQTAGTGFDVPSGIGVPHGNLTH
jgi:hypothetical protein